jgi:4-hydroxybenzoate polyprenyltransferase
VQPVEANPETGARALQAFAEDIKLSHSIFALPFALLAGTLAAVQAEYRVDWGVGSFASILVCMVAARTAAMGANRLLDADLDRLNPRTARRSIPAGRLSRRYVTLAVVLAGVLFLLGCVGFGLVYGNWLPTILGPFVLAFLCCYPLLKRFTSLCHYYLGAALALSPPCAWIAISGDLTLVPLFLAAAVLCWTAGFDVIYATADVEADREHGVNSVPAKFGIGTALWISRTTHVVAFGCLVLTGLASPQLGTIWFGAVTAVGVLLIVEHRLVKPNDLSKVGLAFFTVNGVIAVLLGTAGIIDALT